VADDDQTARDDGERELLAKHRAKNKKARTVQVYAKHDDAEYNFILDGEEAEAVYKRHEGMWKSPEPAEGEAEPGDGKPAPVKRLGRRIG
jgi:hypothetical protein